MIKKKIRYKDYSISAQIYENVSRPTILLLHGFPDNSHLYDLLVPELLDHFQIITFDFLGWGSSDKPDKYNYCSMNQKMELDAVIKELNIENPILVAHDASGPPAIDWAIENQDKVGSLVLLNTYYSNMPTLRAPEAIWLFSTPVIRNVSRFVSRLFNNYIFHKMYYWQVGEFFKNQEIENTYVPILHEQFKVDGKTQRAFFKLNQDLLPTIRRSSKNSDKLCDFKKRVTIIFGSEDKYLNVGVAKEFEKLFPNSRLHLIEDAKHFVQMDAPEKVAEIIRVEHQATFK